MDRIASIVNRFYETLTNGFSFTQLKWMVKGNGFFVIH
jgi:hypothetical protein